MCFFIPARCAAGRMWFFIRELGQTGTFPLAAALAKVRQQRDVRILHRLIYAQHRRVRLGIHRAGEAIAGVAANAAAFAGIFLVEHDADGHVKRVEAIGREVVRQFLDARLMAHRRPRVIARSPGLGRILSASAVHLVKLLRAGVIGLQIAIADRSFWRNSTTMMQLGKVAFAQSIQR